MRTDDRLTFVLEAQANDSDDMERMAVHPIYEGLKLSHSRKDGKMYYDTKVSGELSFVGEEMMWIHQHSLLTKFTLIVNDMGVELVRGTFRKTDCKTDVDHRIITTSIEANDLYEAIDGSNEEWNMVKWGLDKHSLGMLIYPSVQVMPLGSSEMHTFSVGGAYNKGQTSAVVESYSDATDSYLFAKTIHSAFYIGSTCPIEFARGKYVFSGVVLNDSAPSWYANNGGYTVLIIRHATNDYRVSLRFGDNVVRTGYWVDQSQSSLHNDSFTLEQLIGATSILFLSSATDMQGGFSAKCRFWVSCGRIAHDNQSLGTRLSVEDIYDTSHRYFTMRSCPIVISSIVDDEGTPQPPDESNVYHQFYKDSWFDGISAWIGEISLSSTEMASYSITATTNDWYELGDVIAGILNKIDPSIVFEKDSAHSQFFYGEQDPIKGGDPLKLYITQKSNLLEYRYEYPAWSALITWNRMETMLLNLFNLYYDIYVDADGVKHFRLEHWYFYHNGLSYGESSRNSVDLRAVYDMHNGKPMAYKTRQWSYDTDRPYTRREFGWMDNQSEPFDAYPMQAPSGLMIYSRNTIDDRTTDWFSADIDFMLSNNGDASSDGFVIVSADDDGTIEQGVVTIGGISYYCQNYRMALGSLQKDYLLSDWYSPAVTIDNTEELVEVEESMRKGMRLQTVEFRLPADVRPNPESIYVTEIGAGEVESIEVDLTSMEVSATLRHDSEEISNE